MSCTRSERAALLIASVSLARAARRQHPDRMVPVTLRQLPGEVRLPLLCDYVGAKNSLRQHLNDGH